METANISQTMMKMPMMAFSGMRQMAMMPLTAAKMMVPAAAPEADSDDGADEAQPEGGQIRGAVGTMMKMPPFVLMNPMAWTKLGGKMMGQMGGMTKQAVSQLRTADMNPAPIMDMGKDAVTTFVQGSRDVLTGTNGCAESETVAGAPAECDATDSAPPETAAPEASDSAQANDSADADAPPAE